MAGWLPTGMKYFYRPRWYVRVVIDFCDEYAIFDKSISRISNGWPVAPNPSIRGWPPYGLPAQVSGVLRYRQLSE